MLNRLVAAWTIVTIAALGLTACTGAPANSGSTTPSAAAPAEQTTPSAEASTPSGQSLADACIKPTAKLAEASTELAKAATAISDPGKADPKATVKAMTAVVDAFGAMADSANNPEVKDALTGIHEGYGKLRDMLSKVLVDKDYTAAAGYATAAAEVQESLTKFQKLCTA